jgi:hypothetical protein
MVRRSTGGLHRRRASSSSPSRPPRQHLIQTEVGAAEDGWTSRRSLLDLGLLHQPPPHCHPPSSPLYRLDGRRPSLLHGQGEEQMVLVQPCTWNGEHFTGVIISPFVFSILQHQSGDLLDASSTVFLCLNPGLSHGVSTRQQCVEEGVHQPLQR